MLSKEEKFRVLFVCEGNTCRSQMAEGLLRSVGGEGVSVHSAGTTVTESQVNSHAIAVMKEKGVDVSGQVPKSLETLGPIPFDLVVALSDQIARQQIDVFGIPFFLQWTVPDPHSAVETPGLIDRYRQVRDQIARYIDNFVGQGGLEALLVRKHQTGVLLDTLADGIIAHDERRRIFLFNVAAQRITGLGRDEVVGKDCHDVFGPSGLCGTQCSYCLTEGPSYGHVVDGKEYEVAFRRKDGESFRFKMLVSPVKLGMGEMDGILACIRNVTELARLKSMIDERASFHGMIGRSIRMREVFQMIEQTSDSNYPVLITGESGTGKELTALAIHNESSRKNGPFVPVNCGALPEQILESELFGHVKGAFTGAIREKKGRFELANGGTLFLDEIGEISAAFQVKLLRVLEEKQFDKVGGESRVSVDVRIIAATNRDLRALVSKGIFREDLYYRLCVIPIHLPALRERIDDIPDLVKGILKDISAEGGQEIARISDRAMDAIFAYSWPGNIRQLRNALQYASTRCSGDDIDLAHLPPQVRGEDFSETPSVSSTDEPKLTRERVDQALRQAHGNKVRAARMLKVGRATLYRFLSKRPS